MPAGRPKKYDPAFCDVIRAKMAEGYSKTAAACFIGVNRDTLLEWASTHPEFSGAVKDGSARHIRAIQGSSLCTPDFGTAAAPN
jgi:hypothetical protein